MTTHRIKIQITQKSIRSWVTKPKSSILSIQKKKNTHLLEFFLVVPRHPKMILSMFVRLICWPGQNGATFYAKNGRFWPFLLLYSYCNATRTQLIFKNVIYDITFKNKKNQASPSCLNFEKTTQKWPKMAIFAHFWLF